MLDFVRSSSTSSRSRSPLRRQSYRRSERNERLEVFYAKWKTCITLSCNKLGHLSSEFLTIIFELIFYFKNYILGHNFDQDLVQVAMGIQERKKLKISVKTKDGKLFVGYVKSI